MKNIFYVVCCIACLFPVLVNAQGCSDYENNQQGCLLRGGCKWIPDEGDDGWCEECTAHYYHISCSIGNQNCADSCNPCVVDPSNNNWEWNSNFNHPANAVYDSNSANTGLSFCPWKCASGYFKDGDSCTPCPEQGGSPYREGVDLGAMGDTCCTGGNYLIAIPGGAYQCGICGANTNGQNSDLSCKCITGAQLNNDGLSCSCPANSEVSGTTCICKQNYYNANTDVNDEMPICERCPNGTFKDDSGNAGITACQMDHRTKFCNGSGGNCMQLIP